MVNQKLLHFKVEVQGCYLSKLYNTLSIWRRNRKANKLNPRSRCSRSRNSRSRFDKHRNPSTRVSSRDRNDTGGAKQDVLTAVFLLRSVWFRSLWFASLDPEKNRISYIPIDPHRLIPRTIIAGWVCSYIINPSSNNVEPTIISFVRWVYGFLRTSGNEILF